MKQKRSMVEFKILEYRVVSESESDISNKFFIDDEQ